MPRFEQILSAKCGEIMRTKRHAIRFEKAKYKPNMRLIENVGDFDYRKPCFTFCFNKPYEFSVHDAVRKFDGLFWYQPA